MTTQAWLDSRRALALFGAAGLTFVAALFSMRPATAWVAQPEMSPTGADVAQTKAQDRATKGGVLTTTLVDRHNSSIVNVVQIRLAAETRERQRELFDPHDSPLDETRYYPGHGYDVPWDRDPLFGRMRRALATAGFDGGCVRCHGRNEVGAKKHVGHARRHSSDASGARGHALTLPFDLPAHARVRL
jgi:hypothetical protein